MQANLAFEEILAIIKTKDVQEQVVEVSATTLRNFAQRIANKGYVFTDASLNAVKAYLEGYALLLGGSVGTGKTYLLELLGIRKVNLLSVSASKLEDIVKQIEYYQQEEIFLDDIGNEPIYNNYGCKLDILPWIIEKRMNSQYRTHITTNLTSQEITARYGSRITDRLSEMCRPFKFVGASHRRPKSNVAYVKKAAKVDWLLCEEQCLWCNNGGCTKGVITPPAFNEPPYPPRECAFFRSK